MTSRVRRWSCGLLAATAVTAAAQAQTAWLFGEQHDQPDHQRQAAAAVQALAADGRLHAVVLEMAARGFQTHGLPRDASETQVREALQWSESWPWTRYRQVVMNAVRAGIQARARRAHHECPWMLSQQRGDAGAGEQRIDRRKLTPRVAHGGGGGGGPVLSSPLQGSVLRVAVEQGAEVDEGALICVIEAMKMENEITAHVAGKVTELNVSEGAAIDAGEPIAKIEQA